MSVTLFYIASLFIMIDARVSLIKSRSGSLGQRDNIFSVIVGLLGAISSLTIIVWGFMNLEWWIPIASIFGMSFLASFLINQRSFGFFLAISSITNIIIVVFNILIWFLV